MFLKLFICLSEIHIKQDNNIFFVAVCIKQMINISGLFNASLKINLRFYLN